MEKAALIYGRSIQSKVKGRTLFVLAINPNDTAMVLDNFLGNRQTSPCPSTEFIAAVESFKEFKNW